MLVCHETPHPDGGGLLLLIGSADILQSFDEVVENLRRNHDAIPVGADFFGDTYHPAASIALQIDEKRFTIGNDFFRANNIVVHCCKGGAGYEYSPMHLLYYGRVLCQSGNSFLSQKRCLR